MPVKDTVAVVREIDENLPNQQTAPVPDIAQPVIVKHQKALQGNGRKGRHVADEDIFGDKNLKMTGKRHFTLNEEDQVAQIMEHPLSHYTTTDNDDEDYPSRKHDHDSKVGRQRCARRQVMTTEYQRTINKSAERHR